MAKDEDSTIGVKLESPGGSPSCPSFAQAVGHFAFQSPDKRNQSKKEEQDDKTVLCATLTESKHAAKHHLSVPLKTGVADVDVHPSSVSLPKAEIIDANVYRSPPASPPTRRTLRKRAKKTQAIVDSDSDFEDYYGSPSPSPNTQQNKRKRSSGNNGNPRSKQKARGYAEPETYAHLSEVPDRLGTNLDGEHSTARPRR